LLARWVTGRLALWLDAAGALLLLVFFALLTWRIGVFAETLAEQGRTTVILLLPQAPFMHAVAALLGIGTLVQAVVAAHAVARAAAAVQAGAGLRLVTAIGVVIDRVGIALPDLDERLADRPAYVRQHASGQVKRRAFGDHLRSVDDDQVRIDMSRSFGRRARIKRTECLRGCRRTFARLCVRSRARDHERCCSERCQCVAPCECATVVWPGIHERPSDCFAPIRVPSRATITRNAMA